MNLTQLNARLQCNPPLFAEIGIESACPAFTRVRITAVDWEKTTDSLVVILLNLETRFRFRYRQDRKNDDGVPLWRVTFFDPVMKLYLASEQHPHFRIRCPDFESFDSDHIDKGVELIIDDPY